jgi:uncharacterized beta-barrel protein YwiB (DUF1934 family)
MTKEVFVTIDGLQLGDEEGKVTLTASGIYHRRNGKHFIYFDEAAADGEGVTKHSLKIASNQLDIQRNGASTSHMAFDLREVTLADYQTPFGNLQFQIHTTHFFVEEHPEEILVKLQYTLKTDGNHLSENQITIRICTKR